VTVKTHPKLAGYFKMADAGVPVVAIKQKMQVDGYDPSWFDTPDAPSPLPNAPPKKDDYDSD
jgi:WASH complex subunit CCDC53